MNLFARQTIVAALTLGLAALARIQSVPRIWNDDALKDWATPVAGLNARPGHFSEAEFYKAPSDNLRTYPVYAPDREPKGYWEWLKRQKPAPLVDAAAIKAESDWVAAGERAFRELDSPFVRSNDPKFIAAARDPASFKDVFTAEDGSVLNARWVVTGRGVMITITDCSTCHFQVRPDRSVWFGAPPAEIPAGLPQRQNAAFVNPLLELGLRRVTLDEPLGMVAWRLFTVPWNIDPRVEAMREMQPGEVFPLMIGSLRDGVIARTNGSPFFQTRVADLHTLRYHRYLDATATHRLRGPEDIARYAALVSGTDFLPLLSGADSLDFGTYRILTDAQRQVRSRHADEVLYSIGKYLLSLEPRKNPNPAPKEIVDRGETIFIRERCDRCHTPPAFTNGKLAPVEGFEISPNQPNAEDIQTEPLVATDPGLALKTRKGTGFYKIPSLRGVWYRPGLLHNASVSSLEELFDPARLKPDYVGAGWRPPGVKARAIPGHAFSLRLPTDEKAALLAFLRSL
jgi:hypothetical protein